MRKQDNDNDSYFEPQQEGLVRYQRREEGVARYSPRRRKKGFWQKFTDNFIPLRHDEPREIIRKSVLILAVIILVGSAIYIASYFGESKRNEERTGAFKNLWSSAAETGSFEVGDSFPKGYLEKFWPLYELNPDVSGWIEIPGTRVAYPVVQTGNNKDYDRVDFDGNKNQHGIPFTDYRVDLRKPSMNTIIYSHNMNDGQMFGELIGYKKLDYYKQHPLVEYDSVYDEGKYKIFGIVICKADDPDFLYHNYIDKTSDADAQAFINKILERSIIKTTVDVKPTDKLLTLSTCDYSFKDEYGKETARFVVFARKVRDKEAATVDVDNAKVNPNPVMPAAWYKYIEKIHQAELARQASESESASEQDYTLLREEAAKWFTATELAAIKDEDLAAAIEQRKKESSEFLTEEEQEMLSPEEKEKIINDHVIATPVYEEARQIIFNNPELAWMTEVDINAFATQLARTDKTKWDEMMRQHAAQQNASSSSSSSSSSSGADNGAEIYIDNSSMKLQVGDFAVLMATISGGDGSEVKWDTDNHTVATMNPDGTVEAKRKGKCTITATYAGKTATCKLEVSDEPVVEYYIDLPSKMEVLVDQTVTLSPNVTPTEALDKGISWKITGTKSAFSIDSDTLSMMLTGITPGKSVEVTATLRGDSTKTATCKVTVVEPKLQISSSANVKVGETVTIEVLNAPASGDIMWEVVKGQEFADVDAMGNVSGFAAGKATIRATSGNQKSECVVTVKEDTSESGGGGGGGGSSSSSSSESSSSSSSDAGGSSSSTGGAGGGPDESESTAA